ncbi:MAG: hypothetical protein HZB30_02870 [Nitrospirae bacterium]|nr:hypothetical protein [Nitrospirota bacterium]
MKLFEIQKPETDMFEFYTHSILRNNKGIALVMVLIISLISLVIMSGLIYMVTTGTQVSGLEKRYKTALEAGKSSVDIAYQVFSTRGVNTFTAAEAGTISFNITASPTCLADKLNKATVDWDAACDTSLTITPATLSTYDMTFQVVGTNLDYSVYAKIVDTVEGNSSGDEGLIKTGVVISNSGEVTVMHIPYLYTVEIASENTNNRTERTRLSALCQY